MLDPLQYLKVVHRLCTAKVQAKVYPYTIIIMYMSIIIMRMLVRLQAIVQILVSSSSDIIVMSLGLMCYCARIGGPL